MDTCTYRFCGTPLEQVKGGRRRQFCNDACRQAEHRARQADQAEQDARREVASWGEFLPATVDHLARYITAGTRETARKQADMFLAEQAGAQHWKIRYLDERQAHEETTRERNEFYTTCERLIQAHHLAELKIEELEAHLRKQAESKKGRPLGKLEREELEQARVTLRELYQEQARTSEEIHTLYQSGLDLNIKLRQANEQIERLKDELEQAKRATERVQEQGRQYVAMTNERLSKLSGELARYRQAEERANRDQKPVTPAPVIAPAITTESTIPRCTFIYDTRAIKPHKTDTSGPGGYDPAGNYWCAACPLHLKAMQEGAALGFPEVYTFPGNPPEHRVRIVKAGAENWRAYLARFDEDAAKDLLQQLPASFKVWQRDQESAAQS